MGCSIMLGAGKSIKPVTKNASPEADSLLSFIYSISGKKILAGQHCNPLYGSLQLQAVQKQTLQYPAVFGQDFGFSEPGTWDGINYRQQIVDEAIKRYNEGFIITIMWHAVRPIEEEPVDFRQSIQGKITSKDWDDLLTPGTIINERWKSQVDVIAFFLKQLKYAGVPVLWRPYHEMNGNWFWWGGKPGENGYKKLYRMLYDRLVNFHGLNNLIWVFNANEVSLGVDNYAPYYPGDDVVDILATDVYRTGFDSSNYKQLLKLAVDKPIALGEVGQAPPLDKINDQPRWTWFMIWAAPPGFGGMEASENFQDVYKSDQVLTREKLPWVKDTQPKVHYPILK